jgi:hypothetical protein
MEEENIKKRTYAVEGGLWRWSRISMIFPGIEHHVVHLPCIKVISYLSGGLANMATTVATGEAAQPPMRP